MEILFALANELQLKNKKGGKVKRVCTTPGEKQQRFPSLKNLHRKSTLSKKGAHF